jgi:hypothetical protein
MAQHPLMNSPQQWTNNTVLGQNSMLGNSANNAYNANAAILGGVYNANAMQHESSFERTRSFTVEKVDNGFVLRSGSKAKVCKDMDELRDFFVAIMVEHQLDK